MILIIDNYDSFVFNLAQYIGEMGWQPVVHRNNRITIRQIAGMKPTHIILSPGPCTPREAGISNDIIRHFAGRIPILGVCLGHQCIGYVYGGDIIHASIPIHGKSSLIYHDGKEVYNNLPQPFSGGRYHSLVISHNNFPSELELTSKTIDNVIMGVRHKAFTIEGVQFHPESIMTEVGHDLLYNFLTTIHPMRDGGEITP